MTPTEALAEIARVCDGFETDGHGDAVSITSLRAILAEVGDQGGASFTARPIPIPADQPLLALWVHVDLDGRASFGGRMTATDTVTTLRFLADQVEAGDVKLGGQQ